MKNDSALPASGCVLTNGTNAKGSKSCKKQLVKEAINIFKKDINDCLPDSKSSKGCYIIKDWTYTYKFE